MAESFWCLFFQLIAVPRQPAAQNSTLKDAIVTTRADNYAQALNRNTLDIEVEATITNQYSVDEVVMIARDL